MQQSHSKLIYDPIKNQIVYDSVESGSIIYLMNINNSKTWNIKVINKNTYQEYLISLEDEYFACLRFLRLINMIISDAPHEMKVLDCRKGVWYLLEKNKNFYFNIQYDLYYFNYELNIKLNFDEIIDYRLNGKKSLDELANNIYLSHPFYEESQYFSRKIRIRNSVEFKKSIKEFNEKKIISNPNLG